MSGALATIVIVEGEGNNGSVQTFLHGTGVDFSKPFSESSGTVAEAATRWVKAAFNGDNTNMAETLGKQIYAAFAGQGVPLGESYVEWELLDEKTRTRWANAVWAIIEAPVNAG